MSKHLFLIFVLEQLFILFDYWSNQKRQHFSLWLYWAVRTLLIRRSIQELGYVLVIIPKWWNRFSYHFYLFLASLASNHMSMMLYNFMLNRLWKLLLSRMVSTPNPIRHRKSIFSLFSYFLNLFYLRIYFFINFSRSIQDLFHFLSLLKRSEFYSFGWTLSD